MVAYWIVDDWIRLLRFCETNELNRSDAALMKKLEEAMLSIRAGLSEVYHCCLIVDHFSLRIHSLTVAFHVQLLNVRSKFAQSLTVRDDGSWGEALNASTVKADQAQQKRNVFLCFIICTYSFYYFKRSLSMECPPSKNLLTASYPKWIDSGTTPMALQTENLPPTKSQKPNTFFSFIPNLDVSAIFVEQAQMCFSAIKAASVTPIFAYSLISHCLQLFALRVVSAVVKVFELTKIKVSSGLRPKSLAFYLQ